jgi:membrane associated rhomboid family serine protease
MNILKRPFRYVDYKAVYWLIGINALVFLLVKLLGNNIGITLNLGDGESVLMSLSNALAMRPIAVLHGWVWGFVTYMFMHGGFTHLLFNMLGLFFFGVPVEKQMGSREFLLFYFVTGILAGFFSFLVYYFTHNEWAGLVGASGALFAVMLAFAIFNPDAYIYIWGILPIRAPVLVLAYTVITIISSVTGTNSRVAHTTHLAGFGFGWFYFLIRFGVNPWRRLTGRY